MIARLWILLVLVVTAATHATANNLPDKLSPDSVEFGYLDSQRQRIARSADALVLASPSFAPGYIVGVSRKGEAWVLEGYGSLTKGPTPARPTEASCSVSIDEKLGRKVTSLWTKVLAARAFGLKQAGLDGEFYTFALKATGKAGMTWSPSLRYQPKMHRLTQIAEGMFVTCLTGKGLGELDKRIAQLFMMI